MLDKESFFLLCENQLKNFSYLREIKWFSNNIDFHKKIFIGIKYNMAERIDVAIMKDDFPTLLDGIIDEMIRRFMNRKIRKKEMFELFDAVVPNFEYLSKRVCFANSKVLHKNLYLVIRLGMRKRVDSYNQFLSKHFAELARDAFRYSTFHFKDFNRRTLFEIFRTVIPKSKFLLMKPGFIHNKKLHANLFVIVMVRLDKQVDTSVQNIEAHIDSLIVQAIVPKLLNIDVNYDVKCNDNCNNNCNDNCNNNGDDNSDAKCEYQMIKLYVLVCVFFIFFFISVW